MINRSMEEALKRAQKKATDADTDPEAYRDRVLSAARQAMNSAKTDSIEIDHERGKVVFSLARNLGSRSFDAVLRTATNQAKEASRSTGSLLRALLMMISRTVDAR